MKTASFFCCPDLYLGSSYSPLDNFPLNDSSLTEARLVAIAWECAAGAYDHAKEITLGSLCFHIDRRITPSRSGSRKAATIITITEPESEHAPNANWFLPLRVVAIRGSHSKMDHVVNANSRPRGAGTFIV